MMSLLFILFAIAVNASHCDEIEGVLQDAVELNIITEDQARIIKSKCDNSLFE